MRKEYSLYNDDPVIRTCSGIFFNAFAPTPEMVCIEDIAHALAFQCRFGGHLPEFYSVAQHSCLVAELVPDEHKLAALMHDASEAYLLDVPRPIKLRLANYKEIEDGIMNVIAAKYGFAWPMHEEVKKADETMLQVEWNEIMIKGKTIIDCWYPEKAKQTFINQFKLYYD